MLAILERLLRHSIDYAGLFPPAGLSLERVVKNYADYSTLPQRWMLGRLILPVSRLEDFERVAERFLPHHERAEPWRISCLLPSLFEGPNGETRDVKQARSILKTRFDAIRQFNSSHRDTPHGMALVDAIEIATPNVEAIALVAESVIQNHQGTLEVYCECPSNAAEELFAALRSSQRFIRGKIRMGGVEADAIPTIDEVARVLAISVRHEIPLKATAGLHHPLRGDYPLTYERESPEATMHGFLNLFLAACVALDGQAAPLVKQLEMISTVLSSNGSDFTFEPDKIFWRDNIFPLSIVNRVREHVLRSIGSCSFVEPVEDLQELGLLPVDDLGLRT